MQLRDIAAALRKSEDVNDKLRALRNLEGALLAAPDELKHYAGKDKTGALSMHIICTNHMHALHIQICMHIHMHSHANTCA